MSDLPPLRALQVFETVGHSQNIQDAARRLGISAGAVSQQLQLLENHLHTALFFKEGRQLRLTAAGLDYHQRCTKAFELLRDAQAQLMLDEQQQTLHISGLPSLLNEWLMTKLNSWQQRQNIPINLHLHASHREPDYANERIDFRFTYGQSLPQGMHWAELFTDDVLPVCHPDLVKTHTIQQPKDLLKLPLIHVDWQPRFSSPPSWADWFSHYEPTQISELPTAWQSFSLSHQALKAVRQGAGIMLAQYAYVQAELESGQLYAPFPKARLKLDWPYIMTWQPSVFNKDYARDFHRFILQEKPELPKMS